MPRYVLSETMAVWVTFNRVIEAPDADAVWGMYEEGHSDRCREIDPSNKQAWGNWQPIDIGDNIDGYDADVNVIKLWDEQQEPR